MIYSLAVPYGFFCVPEVRPLLDVLDIEPYEWDTLAHQGEH